MRTAAIAAVALFAAVAHGHCRGLDRTALIRLYEAFDGANWANNRNWNTSSGTSAQNKANDPCDHNNRWYGVGFIDPCEKYLDDIIGDGPQTDFLTRVRGSGQGCFAGRITSLLLRRNNLRGNLTVPELGDLANLTYIDLSWNGLEGAIPTEIGRLNNVQIINLAHNNITGELPTELGNINSMGPSAYKGPTGRLTGGCGNDDPCPLGTQLKLTDLSLHHNMITGTFSIYTRLFFFTAFLAPLLSLRTTSHPLLSSLSSCRLDPDRDRRAGPPQAARSRLQQPHRHRTLRDREARPAAGPLLAREPTVRLPPSRVTSQPNGDEILDAAAQCAIWRRAH